MTITDDSRAAARNTVNKAVAAGELTRPDSCERCGRVPERRRWDGSTFYPLNGHHEDYSKPLDVIWLCASCHQLAHPKYSRRKGSRSR
jgi:hypothetical protein